MNRQDGKVGKCLDGMLVRRVQQYMADVEEEQLQLGRSREATLQMLDEHGGVETAKRLLRADQPQTGLYKLWELKLLDSSTEALVLKEHYRLLFTDAEIAEARRRLTELGYFK